MATRKQHIARISALAITSAVKRASILPIKNGRLTLHVVVKYASSDPDGGYNGAPNEDQWGRLLLLVQDREGRTVDAFYARDFKPAEPSNVDWEITPTSPNPPIWWSCDNE